MTTRDLEVALSYASEQAVYVERVAAALKATGVTLFFDRYETAELWGKDLTVHLDDVFRKRARFVVVFISKEYAAKIWPRHELRSALAGAVTAQGEYLLPVRFDETELPGLLPTLVYLDANRHMPEQIADLVQQKLGLGASAAPAIASPPAARPTVAATPIRLPRGVPPEFNAYAEAERFLATLREGLTQRAEALRPSGYLPYASARDGRFKLLVLKASAVKFALEAWIGGSFGGDDTITFHHGWQENRTPGSFTAWGTVVWDTERNLPVIYLTNMGSDTQALSSDELVEHVWQILIDGLEAGSR